MPTLPNPDVTLVLRDDSGLQQFTKYQLYRIPMEMAMFLRFLSIETADLITMFLLGLFGTGHCIGMCGPLILAFPGSRKGLLPHLLYHGGRIFTYTAAGALLGGIGAGIILAAGKAGADPMTWMVRIQVGFSLLAATFLIFFGLFRIGVFKEPDWMSGAEPGKIPGFGHLLRTALAGEKPWAMLPLGMMLGLLPCGLSFAAFARALPAGSPFAGALLVFVFGIGTLPGLLILGTGASTLARRYRAAADLLAGILMIGLGLSLGLDGLRSLF